MQRRETLKVYFYCWIIGTAIGLSALASFYLQHKFRGCFYIRTQKYCGEAAKIIIENSVWAVGILELCLLVGFIIIYLRLRKYDL